MSRFQPPTAMGRERAEVHYSQVHHPFARRLFRDHGEHVTRYVANRANAQYSLRGLFEEEPTAWRFVITEVDDEVPTASAWLPEWAQPLIWEDHRKCIEHIEGWEVAETVEVDHRCGQPVLAKFLFLYGREGVRIDDPETYYIEQHVPEMARLFDAAYGARLYLSNTVRRQAATSDSFGEGAAYTGGYAEGSAVLALGEFYLDNLEWAEEFFSSPDVVRLLRDSPLGRIEGYQVTETIGIDKRRP